MTEWFVMLIRSCMFSQLTVALETRSHEKDTRVSLTTVIRNFWGAAVNAIVKREIIRAVQVYKP